MKLKLQNDHDNLCVVQNGCSMSGHLCGVHVKNLNFDLLTLVEHSICICYFDRGISHTSWGENCFMPSIFFIKKNIFLYFESFSKS